MRLCDFETSGFHIFTISRFRSFTISRFCGFEISGFYIFTISRFRGFTISRFCDFLDLRFHDFAIGIFHDLTNLRLKCFCDFAVLRFIGFAIVRFCDLMKLYGINRKQNVGPRPDRPLPQCASPFKYLLIGLGSPRAAAAEYIRQQLPRGLFPCGFRHGFLCVMRRWGEGTKSGRPPPLCGGESVPG